MKNSLVIAFSITICSIAFVISKIVISVLLYKRWRRKHLIHEEGYPGGKIVIFRSSGLKSLKADVILKKTQKLNSKDIIGSGGYGVVYELKLDDSTALAIKRLNRGTAERDKGRSREKKVLDWPTRYRIAAGAARGISYLHHDCIPHIIHRDIKSSNILLDRNMDARVSDFGLATLMQPTKTHVSTIVAGTFGYLAPEYFDTGRATLQGDVYSFGVVLLELLTGKKPSDEAFMEEGTMLVTWVKAVVRDKKEELVLDNSLGSCSMQEVNKVFSIAMMCLEPDPLKRPTMAEVVSLLEQTEADKLITAS
ncbi:Receptor-like serine/threonine-protein kinase [Glycine max]|nr:Receptor-like serine/threonine-protein kinase [Glycine max]